MSQQHVNLIFKLLDIAAKTYFQHKPVPLRYDLARYGCKRARRRCPFRPEKQGSGGMARSSVSTKKTFTDDFAKELEEALELETAALAAESGDLDIAASMEELEAQIAMAAEELAREGQQDRVEDEAAESPAVSSVEAPAALADAEASAAAEKDGPHLAEPPLAETEPSRFDKTGRDGNLHRAETAPSSSSVLLPANDDRQGEYHVFAGKL